MYDMYRYRPVWTRRSAAGQFNLVVLDERSTRVHVFDTAEEFAQEFLRAQSNDSVIACYAFHGQRLEGAVRQVSEVRMVSGNGAVRICETVPAS